MTTEDFASSVALQRRSQNKSVELLLGLVTGMVADQHLHEMEIKFLAHWLADNPYAASVWPGCVIAQHVQHAIADGIPTEEKRVQLFEVLRQMAVTDFANTGSAAPEVMQLPLQDEEHVDLLGRHICLTGEFIFGTRSDCEKLSVSVGALPVGSLTKKVAYLIIGTNVSPHWAHTSYGRKIQQAMKLRLQGHSIRIISERRWYAATQA